MHSALCIKVQRRFRLTSSNDYQRVRRFGKSYAHPLVVLIAMPNDTDLTRFAVSAGRSVGNAVQRNRAKRLLREALRPLFLRVVPGWDVLLISRGGLAEASFIQVQSALATLLVRSQLLREDGN